MQDKSQPQVVRQKGKQSSVQVVQRDDFRQSLAMITADTADLDSIVKTLEPMLQLNPKFTEIFMLKNCAFVLQYKGATIE